MRQVLRTPARAALALLILALVAACTAPTAPPVPPGPGPLTPAGKSTLFKVKNDHFSGLMRADATAIGSGTAQPVVAFTVEDTPPSIFVNYVVPDANAAAFEAFADLPPGFSLAKVQILESDPAPQYWLSLNVYRVDGVTTGLRAEWSTYVDDGSGVPRFMILQARAGEGSLDPIGPLAFPEPFAHSVDGGGAITTSMNATVLQNGVPVLTGDHLYSSTIELPEPADQDLVVPTREWVNANDFIYWVNGVNDRVFHNASSHSAPLLSVDLGDVTIDDDTEWMSFVDPTPGHVLVYLDEIEFVISPWWNVTELDGRVDAATLASLGSLKKSLYSGMVNSLALGVQAGDTQPTIRSNVDADPASVRWHWKVPAGQLDAFRSAIGLPPGLDLAPVRPEEGDAAAEHWITLHVHQRSLFGAGVRAEWTTYVDDGDGVRELILESRSSLPALDPVDLFTTGSAVSHAVAPDSVQSSVGTGPSAFSSQFSVPPEAQQASFLASREWVAAADLRYWRNGVADKVLYSSSVFELRTSIDPATVTVDYAGEWSAFADATPDRVWLDRSGVDTVVTPWWNLLSL